MIILRLRNVRNALEIVNNSEYVVDYTKVEKGTWNKVFGNDNEIHLEIGVGKGKFIYEMALNNPNINFIGIEKYASILIRAVQKIEEGPLPNLRLVLVDAKNPDLFYKEISCIYLNFSDPWPKNRHAKRRLTSRDFLEIYDNFFKSGKNKIVQKTDNTILFASSLKELNNYGYYFEELTMDLASTNIPNIETEYEQKFKSKGIKINYVKAIKK